MLIGICSRCDQDICSDRCDVLSVAEMTLLFGSLSSLHHWREGFGTGQNVENREQPFPPLEAAMEERSYLDINIMNTMT